MEKAGGEMINHPLMDRLADASALNALLMFAVSSECIVAIIQLARQCTPPNTRYSPWETRSLPCSMRIKKRENTWDGSFYNITIIKKFYLHQKNNPVLSA